MGMMMPMNGRHFLRYGLASVPLIGGVYGLSNLNTASQELQANTLALQAVAGPQAQSYQEYLNSLGNRLGMTTRQLQPSFTQYLANAQGTALEPGIKKDFESFTQYGAVMGLGPEEMKGSLKAITQMVSKQQIYAEELRGQLAERMPAAVRLMADAVTGGDTKKLIEMMNQPTLDPNKVLPSFFEEMRKRSDPMMPAFFKTSRFAEGSMNKAFEDLMKTFAKAGGDEGFTRFFNEMARGAREAVPLVKALAGTFNDLTKLMQPAVNAFKGWNLILQETSKLTGIAEKDLVQLAMVGGLMMTKWGRVAAMFTGILLVIEDIAYGMAGKESFTKDALMFLEGHGMSEGAAKITAVSTALLAVAAALKAISAAGSLPGVGDILGLPKRRRGKGDVSIPDVSLPESVNERGKKMKKPGIPQNVKGGLLAALLGGAGYYIGMNGLPTTDSPLVDVLGYSAAGLWMGGPYGAAVGAMGALANPTWGESRLPIDPETGYKMVAPQNNDDLVMAMMRAREFKYEGQSQNIDVNVKVEANITAENAEDFSRKFAESLQREIEKTMPVYSFSGVNVELPTTLGG